MNRLLLFLLLFLPTIAFAQLYGTGVGYTMGVPTHTPNIAQKGSEACISIEKKMLYLWNRDSLKWKPTAAITVKFGAPTLAPGTGETRTVVNMQTGLLYWWNGSAWKELIAYSVELASSYAASILDLFATDIRAELADSTAAAYAYADSLHLADNDRDSTNELQNLVLLGTVLNITDGNAVDFAAVFANYLLKSDTSAMLGPYISLAGWGLLKSAAHTFRVDTASGKVATRYYVGTNPTTIANTRISVSNGSNLVGYANFNYTDTRPTLSLGTASVTSTSTPSLLDLGNSYSSVAGSNPKILLFSSASTYGIGVSSSQMDYIVGNGANHSFWSTGTKTAYIDVNSIRLPTNKTLKFDAATATATTVALDLFGGTYGLGAFGSFINYVTPAGGGHSFYVSSNVAARVTSNSNVLIGTTTDVTQSILTTSSTTKGSLPFPRMTTTERNSITGTAHLTVGNTTTNTTDVYDAVAGAWTSYGRLNATQSWTGKNTFAANGLSGAVYWTTSNSNHSGFTLDARSVLNAPYTGNWQTIGIVNGGRLSFKNDGTTTLNGSGSSGKVELVPTIGSSVHIALTAQDLSGVTNATQGGIRLTPNRGVASPGAGNAIAVDMSPIYNHTGGGVKTAIGLYYNPTLAAMNNTKHRFIETVSGDWYVGSTSGVMGIRTAPDSKYELKIGGDQLTEDTLFVTSPPTHTTNDGLSVWKNTAKGYALGKAIISSDLKYATGVLSLKHKSLIDSLPIAPVTIDAQDNAFAIIGLNSLYFETEDGNGKIDLTDAIGTIETETDLIFQVFDGDARIVLSDDPSIRMEVTGDEGAHPLIWDTQKFLLGYRSPTQLDTLLRVDIDGTIKAPAYGTGGKQNPASPYIAGYSTTGNLTEYRIRRDTFIEDTNFSVGSLLNTCQELFITTSLTITAPSDAVVTLPAASASLRGKRVTVYGRNDASASYIAIVDVAGGASHLYYTTNTSSTTPSAQATLNLDGTTWPHLGASYTFTCVLIDSSNYRWVLTQ